MPRTLTSARRNYGLSALIARRAVREARKVRNRGAGAVASVVVTHQLAQARTSQTAVADMLMEQEIDVLAEAMLNTVAFTTSPPALESMLEQIDTAAATRGLQHVDEQIVRDTLTQSLNRFDKGGD